MPLTNEQIETIESTCEGIVDELLKEIKDKKLYEAIEDIDEKQFDFTHAVTVLKADQKKSARGKSQVDFVIKGLDYKIMGLTTNQASIPNAQEEISELKAIRNSWLAFRGCLRDNGEISAELKTRLQSYSPNHHP